MKEAIKDIFLRIIKRRGEYKANKEFFLQQIAKKQHGSQIIRWMEMFCICIDKIEPLMRDYLINPQGPFKNELKEELLHNSGLFEKPFPIPISIESSIETIDSLLNLFWGPMQSSTSSARHHPEDQFSQQPSAPLARPASKTITPKPPPTPASSAPAVPKPLRAESTTGQTRPQRASQPISVASRLTPEPLPAPIYNTPKPEGPAITIYLKIQDSSGNDQRRYDILKKRINSTPPPMGKVKKDFFYSLEDLSLDKDFDVTSVEASPELIDLGLKVNMVGYQGLTVTGIPCRGFEGNLNFILSSRRESVEGYRELHNVPMYIAPDPRDLWKNFEVVDYEGYPTPNEDTFGQAFSALGKAVVAASCRGRSHANDGTPRDDYFIVKHDEKSGWLFVAVADGAGSAKYSRKGAELACEAATNKLLEDFTSQTLADVLHQSEDKLKQWKELFEAKEGAVGFEEESVFRSHFKFDNIIHRAVYAAYEAIDAEAKTRGATVRDYHTTLLCAAIKKLSFGYFIITYWIGDGGLCLYDWNRRDRVIVAGIPDGGEFAGEVRFLTMMSEIDAEPIYRRTRHIFTHDFESLILMSDGVSDPFFPTEQSLTNQEYWQSFWTEKLKQGFDDNPGCPELFDPCVSPEEKAQALRQWLNFWSVGNHDDRTILIII